MKFDGTVNIAAPRQKTWDFLTDANEVSQCVPGLESMEIIEEDKRFKAIASVGFGSMKVRFVTDVEWLELDAPNVAQMKAHGTAPGSAVDATATMTLTDGADGSTDMHWETDALVSGQIASLANRLMPSVTKIITAAFFECAKKYIEE